MNATTRIFVYGTLKRGCSNHAQLAGQTYLGPARTAPGYRLYDVGGFPGLIADSADRDGVTGELWIVGAAALARLDQFEGIDEGLYRRESVALAEPTADRVDAYVYARPVAGLRAVGPTWTE